MEPTDEPKKKNRESSVRWQGRTIQQFGYSLNLVLGLSIAGIGYETTLILNKEIAGWQNCLLAISLLSLVVSVGVALWGVVTRLRNFRLTAQIAKNREDGASDLKLQPDRTKSTDLGNFTWTLFWWQIGSFSVGVIVLILVVAGSITVINYGVERKSSETNHISCGPHGLFCSDVRARYSILRTQKSIPLY
jgi:hypothetical protein